MTTSSTYVVNQHAHNSSEGGHHSHPSLFTGTVILNSPTPPSMRHKGNMCGYGIAQRAFAASFVTAPPSRLEFVSTRTRRCFSCTLGLRLVADGRIQINHAEGFSHSRTSRHHFPSKHLSVRVAEELHGYVSVRLRQS